MMVAGPEGSVFFAYIYFGYFKGVLLILIACYMNRRQAVTNLLVASGGWITLPLWMTACRMSDKRQHFSSFSAAEQGLLAGIVDTIIPAGKGAAGAGGVGGAAGAGAAAGGAGAVPIGALSVGADKYLQLLIDDCYEKPVQENVKKQLAAIDVAAKAAYGKEFAACTQQQREGLVMKGLSSADKEEKDFFVLMKTETIRGFNTSQAVMEGYQRYKVAPGHYYGCWPVINV